MQGKRNKTVLKYIYFNKIVKRSIIRIYSKIYWYNFKKKIKKKTFNQIVLLSTDHITFRIVVNRLRINA